MLKNRMYLASILEAALTLLLLLVALQCCKLVLAFIVAAVQAVELLLAEDQNPLMPGALLEQPVQETGPPIHHGLFQARNYPVQVVQPPVQDSQQAFLLGDALMQAVGGLGIAQESLYQRNLLAAMVAGKFKVRYFRKRNCVCILKPSLQGISIEFLFSSVFVLAFLFVNFVVFMFPGSCSEWELSIIACKATVTLLHVCVYVSSYRWQCIFVLRSCTCTFVFPKVYSKVYLIVIPCKSCLNMRKDRD